MSVSSPDLTYAETYLFLTETWQFFLSLLKTFSSWQIFHVIKSCFRLSYWWPGLNLCACLGALLSYIMAILYVGEHFFTFIRQLMQPVHMWVLRQLYILFILQWCVCHSGVLVTALAWQSEGYWLDFLTRVEFFFPSFFFRPTSTRVNLA